MKKFLLLSLISALALTAFTACSQNGSNSDGTGESAHTHQASGVWEADAKEHWQICKCGEKLEKASHTLDDSETCGICRNSISDFGDGTYLVQRLNENGDITHTKLYGEDGTVSEEWLMEYKTDSDGNSYESKNTYLCSDGSKTVTEYDDNSNILVSTAYKADGTKSYETSHKYAVDANGNVYESESTEWDYENDFLAVSEYNQHGDQTLVTRSRIDGSEKEVIRFESEYNADGKRLFLKEYRNDVLVHEIPGYKTYKNDEYSVRFPEKTIDYYSDGTKLVTVYNDFGDVESETGCKQSGEVDYELIYTYETFEDGSYKNVKIHKNGKLFTEKEYTYDEEFRTSYESKITEYDENGAVASVTKYDADGTEIE